MAVTSVIGATRRFVLALEEPRTSCNTRACLHA
jgi:hypothetical protein